MLIHSSAHSPDAVSITSVPCPALGWVGQGGWELLRTLPRQSPDVDKGDRDLPSTHHSACIHHLEKAMAIMSMLVYGYIMEQSCSSSWNCSPFYAVVYMERVLECQKWMGL